MYSLYKSKHSSMPEKKHNIIKKTRRRLSQRKENLTTTINDKDNNQVEKIAEICAGLNYINFSTINKRMQRNK